MHVTGQADAGYFPTPPSVVNAIAGHITNPARHPGRLLDPCSGEGHALAALAAAWYLESYALELEHDRARATASRAAHTLRTDATCCTVQRLSMSALLLNPPYDQDGPGRRTEDTWLKRWTPVLQPGAILIYVIPEVRFSPDVCDYLASYYRQLTVYRFPPAEYRRFQQTVLFGVKVQTPHLSAPLRRQLERQLRHGELPDLPEQPTAPYAIPPLHERGAIVFQTNWLAPDEMLQEAGSRGLWQDRKTHDALTFRPLATCRPLLPLRKGHLTRLIVAGLLNNQVLLQGDQHWILKGRAKKETKELPPLVEEITTKDGLETRTILRLIESFQPQIRAWNVTPGPEYGQYIVIDDEGVPHAGAADPVAVPPDAEESPQRLEQTIAPDSPAPPSGE